MNASLKTRISGSVMVSRYIPAVMKIDSTVFSLLQGKDRFCNLKNPMIDMEIMHNAYEKFSSQQSAFCKDDRPFAGRGYARV